MIPIAKPIIGEEEKKAVLEVLASGIVAQGPKVKEFEEKVAALCGVKHGIAVSNGTAALHTGLHSFGIGQGDEVITTPFTFVATANCILMQGATPVFADIDEETFNLDVESVKEQITRKTKAILPVDLFGQIYDYKAFKDLAEDHQLFLLEDACQSIGAEYHGKKAGSCGDIGTFSFYPTKNIMTGEGGMLVTDDDRFAERARMFRNHGQTKRYFYEELGFNYRMTDLEAAIGIEQLKKLESFIMKRIRNAEMLSRGLERIPGIRVPSVGQNHRHVFNQYTIRVDGYGLNRDALADRLKEKGIGCEIYYPFPLHLQTPFRRLGYKERDFPVAELASRQVLSLPVHPSVTEQDIQFIAKTLREIG